MKPSTIYDVARYAGVSHQTVTRFLQGYEGIRPATRERVEQAISELDYRPNSAARLLRSKRTNRIGVLSDRIDERGPARILAGAGEVAHRRGYVLDIVVADGTSAGSVEESLATLTEHQVVGILATAQTQIVLDELERQAPMIPLVLSPPAELATRSPIRSEYPAEVAADHLLDLGHRNIGYLAGPEVWLAAEGRTAGFVSRVVSRGGTVAWIARGDWTARSGYDAWRELSARSRNVSAVAVANDSMAIGLIAAALESGARVPEDLSVIGTDDLPEAGFIRPALTTVAMDFESEGRYLIERLLAQVESTSFDEVEVPRPPRLVVRASTARP